MRLSLLETSISTLLNGASKPGCYTSREAMPTAAGVLNSLPCLPWETQACRDPAGSLLGCPHRPPLSPASFPGQKQAFSAPLTHEAEILFREANGRGNPNQRHQQGLSALERKGSAGTPSRAHWSPGWFPGCAVFRQAPSLSSVPCKTILSIDCLGTWPYGSIW